MNSKFPLISVVIPVKNESAILGRCLNSLREVEYPSGRLEIIIADGMSRDESPALALSYGAKVVRNEKELVSSGRNRGFEAARGELIAFTDADCIFDKRWLANSLKYFDDKKIGGVGGTTLQPEDSSSFEKAIDCVFHMAELFQSTSHRRRLPGAKEAADIPGCNAITGEKRLKRLCRG